MRAATVLGFWSIYKNADFPNDMDRGWIWLSLGITGIIESHVLTILISTIFIALFCLFMLNKTFHKQVLFSLVKAASSVLLLNLFFIVPFLDYYTNLVLNISTTEITLENATEYAGMLFTSVFDTIGITPDHQSIGGLPLTLGFSGLLILAITFVVITEKYSQKLRQVLLVILVLTFISLWLCTNLFPYRFLSVHLSGFYKILKAIQFPWRFLTIAVITTTCLFVISLMCFSNGIGKKRTYMIGAVICTFAIIQAVSFTGQYISEINAIKDDRLSLVGMPDTFRESGGEYLLENTTLKSLLNSALKCSDPEKTSAEITSRKGLTIQSEVENKTSGTVFVDYPLLNYKGYKAVDAKNNILKTVNGDNNSVRVIIPADYSGLVTVFFSAPISWEIAYGCSLVYFIYFIYRIFRGRRIFKKGRSK
jgi:hypothetical protein